MENGESYQSRHKFLPGIFFVNTGAIHTPPQRRTKGPTPRFTCREVYGVPAPQSVHKSAHRGRHVETWRRSADAERRP